MFVYVCCILSYFCRSFSSLLFPSFLLYPFVPNTILRFPVANIIQPFRGEHKFGLRVCQLEVQRNPWMLGLQTNLWSFDELKEAPGSGWATRISELRILYHGLSRRVSSFRGLQMYSNHLKSTLWLRGLIFHCFLEKALTLLSTLQAQRPGHASLQNLPSSFPRTPPEMREKFAELSAPRMAAAARSSMHLAYQICLSKRMSK